MRQGGSVYLVTLSLLLSLFGCAKVNMGNIEGQHPLRRIDRVPGVQGTLHGSFFVGSGAIDGELSSASTLEFWWGRTDEEMIAVRLPLDKLHFIVDSTKTIPTVQFMGVDQNEKHPMYRKDLSDFERQYPGTWLSTRVTVAVIRISQADLEKEVFLPRIVR